MRNPVINPIYWSAANLIDHGPDTIHELALKAAGTMNSYHVVLGRCLLAVHRTKLYEKFGCSGAVHYGTQVLGLPPHKARALRWVADKLESLPRLSRAGELGEICWSKLREVIRKASTETEEFWLEICRQKNYRDVEKLVRSTPKGAVPGDLPGEDEKEAAITDLRLRLGVTGKTVVERGLQIYSLEQGRPVPLAEAVEMLFAKLVEKDGTPSADLDALAQSQQEARKDLLADEHRRQPLVQEARALAQSMGLTVEAEKCQGLGGAGDSARPVEHLAKEYLEAMKSADMEFAEFPARNIGPLWDQTLAIHQVPCPDNEDLILLANDWRNHRLRFNEEARLPTPAQRREMLRRDGYCCSTPGCPNHLWLEVHHVVLYSRKGKTIGSNLVTLCSRCHKNVHRGHLRISGQAPNKLVFRDSDGRDLYRTHRLGVAGWLDFWLGWSGERADSHQRRWAEAEVAVPAPGNTFSRAGEHF